MLQLLRRGGQILSRLLIREPLPISREEAVDIALAALDEGESQFGRPKVRRRGRTYLVWFPFVDVLGFGTVKVDGHTGEVLEWWVLPR